MAVNPRELFPCSIETLRGLRFEVFLRFSLKTYSKRVLQWTVKICFVIGRDGFLVFVHPLECLGFSSDGVTRKRNLRCAFLRITDLTNQGRVCGQQAFKTEPRNVTVRAGATSLLKCEVLRASGAVQWVKDGLLLGPQRSLPGYPRYSMTGDQQKGQYHLQIFNVSLEDDGPYECQVGRSVSSRAIVSRTAWLNVQIYPSIAQSLLESLSFAFLPSLLPPAVGAGPYV
ncbi:nephrin isoform X1 [Labeo rohita]|uniref:Nephrin isoform X1 n=1 Tax=Labeo rohita TaxID=84645 RepID=A0A498MC91_LABRO|nr:nephrin isoform X1 [Labeo rohita]